MRVAFLLILAVGALTLAIGVPLLVVSLAVAAGRTPSPTLAGTPAAAQRHARRVGGVAWTALTVVMLVGPSLVGLTRSGWLEGPLLGLVPAVAGAAFAAAHLVGELTWPRPTGTVRRAPLVPRTVADVAPAGLRRSLLVASGVLALVLVAFGLVGEGRSVEVSWPEHGAGAGNGPFPGWFYGVPLLVATALVVAAVEDVLRRIARRPVVMEAAPEWDLGLRRASATRLLRGGVLVLGLTAAAVATVGGLSLVAVSTGTSAEGVALTSPPHLVGGWAALLVGVVVLVATLVTVARPQPEAASPAVATPVR